MIPVLKYGYSCQSECSWTNGKLVSCCIYPRRTLRNLIMRWTSMVHSIVCSLGFTELTGYQTMTVHFYIVWHDYSQVPPTPTPIRNPSLTQYCLFLGIHYHRILFHGCQYYSWEPPSALQPLPQLELRNLIMRWSSMVHSIVISLGFTELAGYHSMVVHLYIIWPAK